MKRKCIYVEPADYFPKELRDLLFSDDDSDDEEDDEIEDEAENTEKAAKKK